MSLEPDSTEEGRTVGIDLGTTRSVIARLDEFGRPRTIPNAEGELSTPSAVLFEDGRVIVGKEALRALAVSPDRVAQYAKREMGNPTFSMAFDGVSYPPEMIQSIVLGKLRHDAERALGHPVQFAVITVPAFFDEPKRRATMDAGLLAGLEVRAIINEPTAAAIAYGAANGLLDPHGAFTKPQVILVYDLGGGTFDVSLLKISGKKIDVIAVDGNARLGGIDWDKCVADWMSEELANLHGVSEGELKAGRVDLLRQAEELKHALSARESVKVRARLGNAILQTTLTRETFDDLTAHLLDRTRFTVSKLLTDSHTKWETVDRILLVGGSTRMPQVARMLEKESGITIDRTLSPEEAVAHGAAVYASIAGNRDFGSVPDVESVQITDVNSHHLGVIGIDTTTGLRTRRVMIPKNTRLPAKESATFQTVRKNQPNVLVQVIEGGDASGRHATLIGKFVVYDLPRGLPAGTPIEVEFRYDRDGILEVEAMLPSTGSKASIRIERASGLSTDERDQWRDQARDILEALGLD